MGRKSNDNNRNQHDGQLRREVKRIANRTVSRSDTAKAINAQVAQSRDPLSNPKPFRQVGPEHLLTSQELEFHSAMKEGSDVPHPLVNVNIEPSLTKQKFTTSYMSNLAVVAGTTQQLTVQSATDSHVASSTPKSFGTDNMLNVGAVGGVGTPGPVTVTGFSTPAALTQAATGSVGKVILQRSSSDFGYVTAVPAIVPPPFQATASDGATLRWQLAQIKFEVINKTIGSERGGIAYVIQPTNAPLDLAAGTTDISQFMQRGIFKAFDDMQVGRPNKPIVLDVREGLSAYHHSLTNTSDSMREAAAFLVFTNDTAKIQNLTVITTLVWSLAGAVVRGFAKPHIVPGVVADRAAEANQAMRTANIIPSEQKGSEHLPALMALHSSPALQNQVSGMNPVRALSKVSAHPLIKHVLALAGRHLGSLAKAGFRGLVSLAAKST